MKMKVSKYVFDRIGRSRKDFRRETFFCGGKGGQKQNKTETGVRLTDLVTGLVAEGREHRTQPQNQSAAMKRLATKMIAHYEAEARDRLEQFKNDTVVRNYNEKRSEAKCSVTGLVRDYQKTLDGDLDPFIRGRLMAGDNAG